MSKRDKGRRNPQGNAANKAERVGTVSISGFAEHINALGRIPLDVNRALPLIEKGNLEQGFSQLQGALVKVELAKACILGNLAFAAMKAGDHESALGYLAVAVDSLEDIGLEDNEIFKMLNLAYTNLKGATASAPATGDGAEPGASVEPSDAGK